MPRLRIGDTVVTRERANDDRPRLYTYRVGAVVEITPARVRVHYGDRSLWHGKPNVKLNPFIWSYPK